MNKGKRLIHTGSGPNLINLFFVHLTWESCVQPRNFLKLEGENNQRTRSEGVILFHLQIDHLHILVWLGVVEDLVIDLLLRTSLVDRQFESIFLAERKLRPFFQQPVSIQTQSSKTRSGLSFADREYARTPADETRHNVEVAKPVILTPCSHTSVMITIPSLGHLIIQPKPSALGARHCKQVVESSWQPSSIHFICYQQTCRRSGAHPKAHDHIKNARETTSCCFYRGHLLKSEPDAVAGVHNSPSNIRNTQLSRYKVGEQYDVERFIHNQKDKFQQLNEYAGYRKQLLDMATKLRSL